jgi:DNA helicase-2/ATP-dependent DNA helicase PcrA
MSDLTCLNAFQREAVTFGEGPLLLLAGPGSGKTFTITQRILYLIRERRITPEKLLVITFTREAALSMRQRFAQISPQEVHTVNFGTFHSVFYQILLQSGRISSGNILNDRQKRDLILPILKKITDCKKRSAAEVTELAGNYLAAIGYYKNTGDIENSRKKLPEEEKQHFSRIYEAYEEARKNTGGLDFEDMLKECEEFLQRDPGQRTYWQNRFEYILIDEFQDINYRQYSIVKILAEKHRNIFAVGDDDQAIYGFRGARPACMRQFVEEFGAKQILLRTNYRSHPDIVEASLAVIDENKDRFHKDLEPCEAHRRQAGDHKTDAGYRKEYRVKIREFSEASEQMRYLVQSLKNRINGETCAVLFRTNLAMQGVAARLTGEGIPFSMKEKGRNIYDHFIAQDLLSYLRIAQGCATRADYLRVSNRPYRNISREAFGAEASLLALKKYYEDLTAGSLDAGQQKAQKAVGVWMRQMEFVKNTELKLAMAFLRKACGYERYLRVRAAQEGKTDLTEWQEVLDFITEDAGRYRSLEEWQEAQELYREQLQCRETVRSGMQKKQEKQENSGITLLTVHAAKGLEFDHVWIPDCNEKTFPHGSSREPEHCEEERRIFYVAMTRAKKDLELLCLTGTRERPRFPSRFLIPLNRYHR